MKTLVYLSVFVSLIFTLTILSVHDAQAVVPGANGKIIFYNSGIYSMNPDFTDVTQLTGPEGYSPRWSPDGTKIAFYNGGIYVMNSDGSNLHLVYSGDYYDFDSCKTALVASNGQLSHCDFVAASDPAWSPDGTKIAFTSVMGVFLQNYCNFGICVPQTTSGQGDIVIMNADGSNVLRVTSTEGIIEGTPDWSPDGTRLAFGLNQFSFNSYHIGVVNIDGTGYNAPHLGEIGGDFNPRWSPDGTKILYYKSGLYYIINPELTVETPLNFDSYNGYPPTPGAWSPDGTKFFGLCASGVHPGNHPCIFNSDGTGTPTMDDEIVVDNPWWLDWGVQPSTPSESTVSINDVSQFEGNSGTTNFVFTVTRSGDTSGSSTVAFQTADGTATVSPGADYNSNSGTLNFGPTDTTQTVTVQVNGDTGVELDETFFVNLSNCAGCSISDNQGIGTIQADDVILSATKDSTIATAGNDQNDGANNILSISDSGNRRPLVAFDLSGYAGKHVTNAKLRLYVTLNGNDWGTKLVKGIEVHRLTSDWTEGNAVQYVPSKLNPAEKIAKTDGSGAGVTWNCATDTNINNAKPNCASKWRGGTFSASISDSKTVNNSIVNQWIELTVTNEVNSILDGTNANYGWLIKRSNEQNSGSIFVRSSENPFTSFRPQLVLTLG